MFFFIFLNARRRTRISPARPGLVTAVLQNLLLNLFFHLFFFLNGDTADILRQTGSVAPLIGLLPYWPLVDNDAG